MIIQLLLEASRIVLAHKNFVKTRGDLSIDPEMTQID